MRFVIIVIFLYHFKIIIASEKENVSQQAEKNAEGITKSSAG